MKVLKHLNLLLVILPSLLLTGIALTFNSTSATSVIKSVSYQNNPFLVDSATGKGHSFSKTSGVIAGVNKGLFGGGNIGGTASNNDTNSSIAKNDDKKGSNTAAAAITKTATTQNKPKTGPQTTVATPSLGAASLVASSTNITLPQISATSDGSAYLTISSNVGSINQPVGSGYQKTAILETTGTPPSDEIFRSQWTFKLVRNADAVYGSDGITFTTRNTAGKVLSIYISVNILPTPNFTVTKGPLAKVANPDGTVTYTAHLYLNPSPYFGNPQLHMCQLNSMGYCSASNDFTYTGNNDLTMSQTISPFPSGSIHAYFDMSILIDGWYTKGGGTYSWHEDY